MSANVGITLDHSAPNHVDAQPTVRILFDPALVSTLATRRLATASVPHIAWPLELIGGHLAVLEQDSLDEVTQAVNVLLHTPRGARVLAPDFGIDDPTFTEGLDTDEVLTQVAAYEDRAVVDVVETVADDTGVVTTRLEIDLA